MNVIPPLSITDALLTSSTVAEPDTGEVVYNAGTTYAISNVVISTTTHLKYTSLQGGNIGHPLSAAIEQGDVPTVTDWWVKSGPTHRWAMFDPLRSTATVAPLTMTQVITPGVRIDALALHGMVADTALITVNTGTPETGTAQAGAPQSLTLAAGANTTPDFYQYMAVRITGGTGAGQSANVVTSRQNLELQSNAFTTSPWVNDCTSVQNVTGYTGIPNEAWTLTDSSASTIRVLSKALSLTATQPNTRQIKIKKTVGAQASYPILYLSFYPTANNLGIITIDTSNGIVTPWTAFTGFTIIPTTATCVDAGGGFWLVTITCVPSETGTWTFVLAPAGTSVANQSTGGYDTTLMGTCVAEQSQIELGSVATAYIATVANAAVGVAIATPWATQPDATSVYELDQYAHLETLNGRDSLALFDLPPFSNGIITLTLNAASGNVACGAFDLGMYQYIGEMVYNAESDVMNFSTITRNIDGSLSELTPRPNVPKIIAQIVVDKAYVNAVRTLREALAGQPATWAGVTDNSDGFCETLLMHGKYNVFRINMDQPMQSTISLEVEEI
jgi:hypothetical protein